MAYQYDINGTQVERYAIELLPTALLLHGMAVGSTDADYTVAADAVARLEARLNDWQPSKSTEEFDTHVRRVCICAIQEWHRFKENSRTVAMVDSA